MRDSDPDTSCTGRDGHSGVCRPACGMPPCAAWGGVSESVGQRVGERGMPSAATGEG